LLNLIQKEHQQSFKNVETNELVYDTEENNNVEINVY